MAKPGEPGGPSLNPSGLPAGARIMDVFRPKWLEQPGNIERVHEFAKLGIPVKQSLASIGVNSKTYERWLERAKEKRAYHAKNGQVKADIDWVYLFFLHCHEEGRGISERELLNDLRDFKNGVDETTVTKRYDGDGKLIEETSAIKTRRSESAAKWMLTHVHPDKYGPNARGESDGDAALNKRVRLVDGAGNDGGSE